MASAIQEITSSEITNQQIQTQQINDQSSTSSSLSSDWFGSVAAIMAASGSLGSDMMKSLNEANNEQHLKDLVSAATNRNGVGLDSKIESMKTLNDRFKLNLDSNINDLINDKKTYESESARMASEMKKAGKSAGQVNDALTSLAVCCGVAVALSGPIGLLGVAVSGVLAGVFGSSAKKHSERANDASAKASKASAEISSTQNKMKQKLDNEGSKQEATKAMIDAKQNSIKSSGSFFSSL